jgi:subtilisin
MNIKGNIKRFGIFFLALVLALGLLGAAVPAAAQADSALERETFLVGFQGPPDPRLVEQFGGEVYRQFIIVNVVAARMTSQAADALTRHPMVRYVEPDGVVYAVGQTVPWGIDRVFGDEEYPFDTWETSTGLDMTVAVLDTGIDEEHEDLPELSGGVNTIDDTHWGSDDSGHGTHVAGTVAALDNELGVVGVTPEVGLYAVKVLDDSGSGTVSSVVAGIEWAVEEGIPIMNMSLGTGTHYQTLQDACDAAYSTGHLLVAAAGNSGNPPGRGDNVGYPAAYDSVIAVAASDSNDNRASFSSTGPEVELIAPGVSVLSTLPGDEYGTYSGTSMASPHVAGAAALAWAVNSDLTNAEIREILQDTAEDLGLDPNHQGHGLVRADLAVRAASELEPQPTGDIEGAVEDEDEAAIEGATVVVEGTSLSATTDADGYYLLENVPAGDQEVTASADGYYAKTATVTVVEDETVSHDFTLEAIPTYTVSGTVTDADRSALEGATVTIEETGQSATTDSEGFYKIENVEEGTYDITASKSGYISETETITVESDTTVDFVLEEATVATEVRVESITYTTRGGRNNDRHLDITLLLLDNLDDPVADAAVSATLHRDDGSSWNFAGTTGSDGTVTFTLNNHGSGCYYTEVTAVEAEGLEWDGETPPNEYCKE